MRDIYERLGGRANFHIAGSECDMAERANQIIAANCVLAPWKPDVSHLWWGDVAYAAALNQPIISGTIGDDESGEDHYIYCTDAALLGRVSKMIPITSSTQATGSIAAGVEVAE